MKSSRAFTLIELLVVIAIIGILMALLFPAIGSAMNAARRAQAKNDTVQIATAITAYETEYGYVPTAWFSKTNVDSEIIAALTAAPGNTNNKRQITFIEVQAVKKGKSGTNSSGTFVDPWKQEYGIKFDDDYNNRIENVLDSPTIMKKVAVYSPGIPKKGSDKDAAGYAPNTEQKKFVKSWE